jgi:hypothetical protein
MGNRMLINTLYRNREQIIKIGDLILDDDGYNIIVSLSRDECKVYILKSGQEKNVDVGKLLEEQPRDSHIPYDNNTSSANKEYEKIMSWYDKQFDDFFIKYPQLKEKIPSNIYDALESELYNNNKIKLATVIKNQNDGDVVETDIMFSLGERELYGDGILKSERRIHNKNK